MLLTMNGFLINSTHESICINTQLTFVLIENENIHRKAKRFIKIICNYVTENMYTTQHIRYRRNIH